MLELSKDAKDLLHELFASEKGKVNVMTRRAAAKELVDVGLVQDRRGWARLTRAGIFAAEREKQC